MARIANGLNISVATRRGPILAASSGPAPFRPVRYRIGSFELNPISGELTSQDTKILLQWQPLQLLLMLIEHGGEVVTRNEIEKRIWGDDVIVDFDRSINQLVRKLRRVLGDSAEAPAFIETLASRGYRLKVPVEIVKKPGANLEATDGSMVPLITPKDCDNRERAASVQSAAVRLQYIADSTEHGIVGRAFRCRRRASYSWEQRRDNVMPMAGTVASRHLCESLSSATPAERLDVLRQLLLLAVQALEGS